MNSNEKLVRDKIPEIVKQTKKSLKFKIIPKSQIKKALIKKLIEEISEFEADPCTGELADILEVIYGLAKAHKISLKRLESKRIEKRKNRGAFNKRICLVTRSK